MKMQYYFLILFLLSSLSSQAFSADDETQEAGVKINGVVYNIAKDRKLEKVGGIYNPEGLDRYIERRMSEVTDRLRAMEIQLDGVNKKLDELSAQMSRAAASSTLTTDHPKK